jgi:hypothetical protein
MRLSRFLSVVFTITSLSLLYAFQQTEVYRLAYAGQKQQTVYEDLLDKNNFLRYNIQVHASLVNIGSRISASTDYVMPDSYRFVRVASSRGAAGAQAKPAATLAILSRILGIKREAEAKTISP